MKLKYYLRGVGIGIVFATIIMGVSSSIHKNNISDEYIIKEAEKLGMVMKEESGSSNGLFGNGDSKETEEVQETEDGFKGTEEIEGNQVIDSEEQSSEPESESQMPVESENPVESESEEMVYVTVVVRGGDSASQVAEKVKEAGLVDDAKEFSIYLRNHGYAYDILVGSFQIPIGADFEEICKILTTKR